MANPISHSDQPVQDCQQYLAQVTKDIAGRFHPTGPVWPLLSARSDAVDNVLNHLWQFYLDQRCDLALAAVGGYGRGELYPFSDIDLLILVNDSPNEDTATQISELLRNLWDIGLKVGSSVRTLEECETQAREDLTIFTSLLEARYK